MENKATERVLEEAPKIIDKITDVRKGIESELKNAERLFNELCNYHQEEAFGTLPATEFIRLWVTPRINIRDNILQQVETLESQENKLIKELEQETQNVLDLIDLKLESQIKVLQRAVTNINRFVINESLLGPNIKSKIEKLISKIKEKNVSELEERFATKELDQKIAAYKGFLLTEKEKIKLAALTSIEETNKFKEDIIKKIKEVISKCQDPMLEQRKAKFKQLLNKIDTQVQLIQNMLEKLKENGDYGF